MSGAGNEKAIAAVTATLQKLLETELKKDDPNFWVTIDPPDKAHENVEKESRVNLFLYHTLPNAAWRNMDLPPYSKAGEIALPPLALNLYYLITPYTENDLENRGHRMLGRVMSILHDNCVLSPQDIQSAFPDSDLQDQVERVRITFQPLSLDEMSKIWATFQSQYRISVAYQVGVVLIESTRPRTLALPVLRRGQDDRGVFTSPEPAPALSEIRALWNLRDDTAGSPTGANLVRPASPQAIARLGDTLTLLGQNLGGEGIQVRFSSPRLAEPVLLAPLPDRRVTELRVQLPETTAGPANPGEDPQMARWAPGFYSVALVTSRPPLPAWSSNELVFALAPIITVNPTSVPAGPVTLNVTVSPRLRPEQRPVLILGSGRQIPADPFANPADPTQPTPLAFNFTASPAEIGKHLVRLRVDGVDSLPYAFKDQQIIFDPQQEVTIT